MELELPWWQIVVRSLILYAGLLILFRLRKRSGGELSAIDLVVTVTIGNLIAGAAVASDHSVTAALLSAAIFVGTSSLISFLAAYSKPLQHLIEGKPCILVHNGKIDVKSLRQQQLNKEDLMEQLRAQGILRVDQVHVAILEPSGQITVVEKKDNKTA